MMMDNLGWGEIGAYGGGILRGAETPRLDALALLDRETQPFRRTLASLVDRGGPGLELLPVGRDDVVPHL